MSPALPGQRGPLRFEEGLATDTDVPMEFTKGAMQGYIPAPGRPNHNQNVFEKSAEETMRERAHVGSAAWVEAPTVLQDFAMEAFADHGQNEFAEVFRDGGHQFRLNPSVIQD
jgi:malate synthase